MSWNKCYPNLIGKAIYPFNKQIDHGLKLTPGDIVIISSKTDEWYYGYSLLKSTPLSKPGIFPCSYIKILGKDEKIINDESSVDTLKTRLLNAADVHYNLWISKIHSLVEENQTEEFLETENSLNNLVELSYEVASWTLNKEKLTKFQNLLWISMTNINNLLDCDAIFKTKDFSILSIANFPLTQLEKMHYENMQMSNDLANLSETNKPDESILTNIFITVDNFEYLGCFDEIILQWLITDTGNELHFEHFWQPIKDTRKGRPAWMGEKFLFKHVPRDIKKETVYLIVYVYRIGQLLADPNKQLSEKFRRPIAFGSFNLKEVSSANEKLSIILHSLNESEFLKSTKEILRMKFPVTAQNRFIQISVNMNSNSNLSSEGIEENHILENIFPGNEVLNQTDRHCLYIRLDSAEFDRDNKKSAKNVECQVSIKSLSGVKQSCINWNSEKGNKTDCYFSSVTYHSNSPKWKDLIKVNLFEINPYDCHIMIDFYHCTTKDKKGEERKHFGSCFIRLIDFFDFEISLKQFTLSTQKISASCQKYLKKQISISPEQEKNNLKEYCKITLVLCSTYLSIKKDINEFLMMEDKDKVSIADLRLYQKNVQMLTDEDFLKPNLRKNITETIKSFILMKNCTFNETFEIELFITWQVITHKFIKFGLKDELFQHLKGGFVFVDFLLRGIQYVMKDTVTSNISYDTITVVMTSMEPVFMVLSNYSDPEYQFQISERIKEILRWILYFFLGHYNSDPSKDIRKILIDCTIYNLKNFHHFISMDVLLDFFNNLFQSKDFLDDKVLPTEKLEFINNLLDSGIHVDNTDILLTFFFPTIHVCSKLIDLSSSFTLPATEVLLNLFDEVKQLLQEERVDLFSEKIMHSFFVKIFSVFLAKNFREQQKLKYLARQESEDIVSKNKIANNSSSIEVLVSVECQKLYTLLFSYLEEWLEISNSYINLNEFVVVISDIKILIETNIYSRRWTSMYLKTSSICAGILEKAAEYLQDKNEDAFNKLIPVFLEACFVFLMQPCLQLQNFSLAKRQKIIDEYGDLRLDVLDYFLNVWKIKPANLENIDKSFSIQTTMKILKISFLKVPEIRKKMISLLIHSITNWLDASNSINEVLLPLILDTEILLRNGHGDSQYYDSLYSIEVAGKIPEDVLIVIKSFTKLINLHLEYRNLTDSKSNSLHLQFLLHAFMKFYQEEVKNLNYFQQYSQKFSQILEADEQYLESALVLKQQYDSLTWDQLEHDTIFYENYEGMSSDNQKSQLSKKILDLLNRSKEYEYAADLCKEEYKYYLKAYKYNELSPILRQWATYYELIMTEPRLTLNYYRVTIFGGILPCYMKPHRDYIFKCSMWFKINNLIAIIQNAFPDAKIQFYQSTPPVEQIYEQKMVIYLAKMDSILSETDFFKNRQISPKIRNFYKDHDICLFSSDHPFHKGTVDKENEIKTLHICRVTVMTEMKMPNLFMWNPIIHHERIILSPIEVGIDTVLKKNQFFRDTIDEYLENPQKDLRSFTMLLTGTLDAGVNGGMAKYIEAFFNESNEDEETADIQHINRFREVLIEQRNVISEALALHKKLIPQQIQQLQERLEECFSFLTRTVNDLNIFRKRTFSKMQTLDDVYARMQSFISKENAESFESPNFEKESFREGSRISDNQLCFIEDEANRSSAETSSSVNTIFRQNTTASDKVGVRNKNEASIRDRRKVSSTDEETITKLAKSYLLQGNDNYSSAMIPYSSNPDIPLPSASSSLEDVKSSPIKSPPLPPGKDEIPNQTTKEKTKINRLWQFDFKKKIQKPFAGNPFK